MATALISIYPDLAAGAVLFRPLSPFATPASTRLPGIPVLIIDGSKDDRRMSADGHRLVEYLKVAGAVVTHHQLPGGHTINEAGLLPGSGVDRSSASEHSQRLKKCCGRTRFARRAPFSLRPTADSVTAHVELAFVLVRRAKSETFVQP
jgi:dienelactone hydrolase